MNRIVSTISLVCALACAGLRADVVQLKNGNVLNGTYRGGTASTISFEAYGNVMQLSKNDVASVIFDSPAPAETMAAPSSAAAPAAAAVAPSGPVTVPVGTILLVRMVDAVSSKSKVGASFSTKLEYDLIANGAIVAKAGTIIYGKVQSATQAKRARGQSTLDIRLVQISTKGGPVPIATSAYAQAGENSIKKVAKAAAAGAVIGNNTGSGDQGEGAAIGAGVAMLKPGETVTVSAGALIEFTLSQPVNLPPAG